MASPARRGSPPSGLGALDGPDGEAGPARTTPHPHPRAPHHQRANRWHPTNLSYSCTTIGCVPVRKKRSISLPPDLDAQIEAAAHDAGMTYSGWLAATARKEFIIRAGLDAVAEFEREHGSFTPDELAEAQAWVHDVVGPHKQPGGRRRRSA